MISFLVIKLHFHFIMKRALLCLGDTFFFFFYPFTCWRAPGLAPPLSCSEWQSLWYVVMEFSGYTCRSGVARSLGRASCSFPFGNSHSDFHWTSLSLYSQTYKKPRHLTPATTERSNAVKDWAKDLNKCFPQEESQMASQRFSSTGRDTSIRDASITMFTTILS